MSDFQQKTMTHTKSQEKTQSLEPDLDRTNMLKLLDKAFKTAIITTVRS